MKRLAILVPVLVCAGLAGAVVGAAQTVAVASGGTTERVAVAPLRVPKLGIAGAAIIPVGIDGRGQLAVGPSVHAVYTWNKGVRPGQPGSAVLAGHTWSRGAGIFDNLGTMKVGDRLSVGRSSFRVTRVERVRSMSSEHVRDLFSDRGPSRVVLITCGDRSAATGVYASRILVHASKVRR